MGSIAPGKRANLTILDDNPLTVDAMRIKDIKVRGTVMEGRKLPTGPGAMKRASLGGARRERKRAGCRANPRRRWWARHGQCDRAGQSSAACRARTNQA